MTLTPNFLPVGSVVEYHLMNHNRWTPIRLNATDILNLETDSKHFNTFHRPIKLTPEILTEWCGFEMWKENIFRKHWGRNGVEFIVIFPDGLFYYETGNNSHRHIEFLHQLQMGYAFRTQTVLPITIK